MTQITINLKVLCMTVKTRNLNGCGHECIFKAFQDAKLVYTVGHTHSCLN